MNGVLYILNNLIQIIECVFFLEQIAKPRFKFSTICGFWLAGVVLVFVLGRAVPLSQDLQGDLRILLGAVVMIGLYHGKIIKRILTYLLVLVFSLSSEFVGLKVCSELYHLPYEELSIKENYIVFAMILIADVLFISCLVFSIFWRRKELWIHGNFRQLGIMLLFVSIHFLMVIVYYLDQSVLDNPRNQMIQTGFQLLLYFALIFNYFNALRTRKLMESEQALRNLETEMEHNYQYYTLADEKFTEVSKLRHDILNEIQTVQYLLRNGENEQEARAIMQRIEEQLAAAKTVHFCQNPIINSVLTVKMNTVQASGIETDILLSDCGDLPFDNYDICSLFANLYDNAVEACQKLEEGKERFIEMRSGIQNDFFVLKLRNSCGEMPGMKNGEMPKSDKGSDAHGYGTKIIENIAKKYDGSFTMRFENGVMTAVVALKQTAIKK